MHSLDNLIGMSTSFQARVMSGSQFGQSLAAAAHHFEEPKASKPKKSKKQKSTNTAAVAPSTNAHQAYILPETRQYSPEQDDPVNRNKSRQMVAKAQALKADLEARGHI